MLSRWLAIALGLVPLWFVPAAVAAAAGTAGVVALGSAAGTTNATTAREVAVGSVLREAKLKGLNGPSRQLSSYRGKPLIINVWASWCGPCREEAASLEQLAWSPLGASVTIIGISTDDFAENAQGWLRQSNATLTHYIDQQLEMETMLGASHLPLTVFVDANGKVLRKVTGAQDWTGPRAAGWIRAAFPNKLPHP